MPDRRHHWTRIVGAEYLACVVLLGASPFGNAKGPTAIVEPFARMTATSALFVVLALFSAGRTSGKLAAALGGLVTLGIMFNARNTITGIAGLISAQTAQTPVDVHVQQGPPLAPPPGVAPVPVPTGPNADLAGG